MTARSIANGVDVFVMLSALVLAPVYILVIAPFVSLKDYYNRKSELDSDQKASLSGKINNMSLEQIETLTQTLEGSSCLNGPSSYASIGLIEVLKTWPIYTQEKISKFRKDKEEELKYSRQSNPDAIVTQYIDQLKPSILKIQEQCQKAMLKDFINTEQNAGKKTQKRIWDFFFPKESPAQSPTCTPTGSFAKTG